MFKWSTTENNSIEQALKLSDVLKEEAAYLNRVDSGKSGLRFTIIGAQDLVAKLTSERQQKLRTESTQEAPKEGSAAEGMASTPFAGSYAKTPFYHLEEWLAGQPITKEAILKALEEKAQHKNLLAEEPWLVDAAIRSYTRGLVEEYQNQQAQKNVNSTIQVEQLNQLLLEDAFSEYIQPEDSSDSSDIFSKLLTRNQSALCLSGGGIRSATFGLGVIQGLARSNVLDKFTYLSTVSGGGYVGSWLSAWSHHEGFDRVVEALNKQSDTPTASEAAPVRHLRQYSNYLSPQLGFFSADTWTLIATYIRNLLLVWLVIIPFMAALTAVPWIATTLARFDIDKTEPYAGWMLSILLALGCLLAVYSIRFIHAFIPDSKILDSGKATAKDQLLESIRNQTAFIKHCLFPLLGAILLLMLVWMWATHSNSSAPWSSWLREAFEIGKSNEITIWSYGGWVIMAGTASIHVLSWLWARPSSKTPLLQLGMFSIIAITGGVAGLLMLSVTELLHAGVEEDLSKSYYTQTTLLTVFGLPCFLLAILLAGYLLEGITSRFNNDSRREWTARYSAWVLIVGVSWLIVNSIVLFGPKLMDNLESQIAGLGLGSSLLTGLLGWSSKTAGGGQGAGSRQGKGNATTPLGLLAQFTLPIVTILTLVILLIVLSRINLAFFTAINTAMFGGLKPGKDFLIADYEIIPFYIPVGICLFLVAAGFLFGSLIDTNRFSLHAMYRARLIRAYLGASRPDSDRHPDPFTGFDENDNLPMGKLDIKDEPPASEGTTRVPYNRGPFHIINVALNLTTGRNLAWQERKAESFTISPLHAGTLNLGYRRTRPTDAEGNVINKMKDWPEKYQACYGGGKDTSISLGTAMTISGAAASPNMGYHSSPLVAFLMTLLNIRLGWWLGNPGPAGNDTFAQKSPKVAIKPILDELFGQTDDLNNYVYLSDGGHFENLGLYEMVLRRNRFIVVSDASCDEEYTFEDLGNAIRKIRIDLGIPIEFTSDFYIQSRMAKLPESTPGAYWAFGRIRYSVVSKADRPVDEIDGLILYIKPAFYNKDEPRDVVNYALSQVAFPHEPTSDQFFSESQFESYRALGSYIMDSLHKAFPNDAAFTFADFFKEDGPQKFWASVRKKS